MKGHTQGRQAEEWQSWEKDQVVCLSIRSYSSRTTCGLWEKG